METIHTLGESQFLRDSTCNLGSSGVTVEVDFVHAVPVHVRPAQLQAVDGWPGGGGKRGNGESRGTMAGGAKKWRIQQEK